MDNVTQSWMETESAGASASLNWAVLALSALIVSTATGNSLVCVAICKESHLQTMTNYFLFSLAIADLLVAILVMPTGMYVELLGKRSPYRHVDPLFCRTCTCICTCK